MLMQPRVVMPPTPQSAHSKGYGDECFGFIWCVILGSLVRNVRQERKARNDLTIVASFAAIGMLVSVLALIDDSTGLTAWFGLTVPPVDFLN
jgi:peptidoglycan/LPS O-acetylase OafA/YrhL